MFRRDFSNQWLTMTAPLAYVPKGVSDLVITSEGDPGVSIDWVQFKNRPKYFSPVTTASTQPDDDGFIRRWLILEPLDKPNSGNTVFTDSYLRENFAIEYFKGQQTIVPKDGQKVKAVYQKTEVAPGFGRSFGQQAPAEPKVTTVKQTLTWHALDSERLSRSSTVRRISKTYASPSAPTPPLCGGSTVRRLSCSLATAVW